MLGGVVRTPIVICMSSYWRRIGVLVVETCKACNRNRLLLDLGSSYSVAIAVGVWLLGRFHSHLSLLRRFIVGHAEDKAESFFGHRLLSIIGRRIGVTSVDHLVS